MTKKKRKKKESWKERRRRAALKVQKALEAERLKREREPKKRKGWTKGKTFGVLFLVSIALVMGAYATWQNAQPQNENESELPRLYVLTNPEFNEFRGKVVVVDCFATECGHCKDEFPYLRQIYDKYNHSEVIVISVGSAGDSTTELRKFKRDFNMTWLVAHDTVGVFDRYEVMAIPKLIILDQNGNIYYQHEGVTDATTLSAKIDELLGS